MFDTNNIQCNQATGQWICSCHCNSPSDAEYISAKYVMIAKQFDFLGEIYTRGNIAIIGASSKTAAYEIASYINASL